MKKAKNKLPKDTSFHLPKLPYLPSNSTLNYSHKIDSAITKRFKTQPKYAQRAENSTRKMQRKKMSNSYQVLPQIVTSPLENSKFEETVQYHSKVVKALDKHRPENSSKSLFYDMKVQGQRQFNKNKKGKRLKDSDSIFFSIQKDEIEKGKTINIKEYNLIETENPEKLQQARNNEKKKEFLDKVVNIRTMSKNLKEKSNKLYKKFQEMNIYTSSQYQKLQEKDILNDKFYDKRISESSLSSFKQSQLQD